MGKCMRASPRAEPRTVRISFQIPEEQWAEFEQLSVKDALFQVLGVKVTRQDPTGMWQPYYTETAHGKLRKNTFCFVNRASDGRIGVKVRHASVLRGKKPSRTGNQILLYVGSLWYIRGLEAPEGRRPF